MELTIAPGKMSLFANVLDFEIIKVFKHIMRKKIRTWFEADLYREMCMWIKETIDVLNLPENCVKWAKGLHQCGCSFYDRGMDMNILGSSHRALLTGPTLEGYAVLPSVEFAQRHNAQLLGLGEDDVLLGSDYKSGDDQEDAPIGVTGEVCAEERDIYTSASDKTYTQQK